MSTAERDTQHADLRERIVEAARDIVSEEGLDALSMRALGVRIGHSPGTIYQHFQDKKELLGNVMDEGFKRLDRSMTAELGKVDPGASGLDRYAAMGRGYARFALENTGYFRAMFRIADVAHFEGCPEGARRAPESSRDRGVELLRQAMEAGEAEVGDPVSAALVGWGLMHGLTSLFLSGHLRERVGSHDEFMDLIEDAIQALAQGWLPRSRSVGTSDG